MPGLTEIHRLLTEMDPELRPGEFVFCSFPGARYGDLGWLSPVAMVSEDEGMTLVLDRAIAERAGLPFEAAFREILLGVHSSLLAVGLTAAVSAALAKQNIAANLVAGLYHDHLFVPSGQAEQALRVLQELG